MTKHEALAFACRARIEAALATDRHMRLAWETRARVFGVLAA